MRKLGLMLGLVVVAFACSEQAGQMLTDAGQMMMDAGDAMTPDAGAQGDIFEYMCPADNQFLLTDVDQRELGKIIIHQDFPDPWEVTDSKIVKAQQYAWWSVEGKVLVQCTPGRGFTLEVRP